MSDNNISSYLTKVKQKMETATFDRNDGTCLVELVELLMKQRDFQWFHAHVDSRDDDDDTLESLNRSVDKIIARYEGDK